MTGDNTKENDPGPAPDDIPEVDAEIVDDAAGEAPEPFDEPAREGNDSPPPKRSLMSAGVLLFAGLVVVASAAGAIWYITKDDTKTPNAGETSVTQPAAIPDTEPGAAATSDAKLSNEFASNAKPETSPVRPPSETLSESVATLATPTETIANKALQDDAKAAALVADPLLDAQDAAPIEPAPTERTTNTEPAQSDVVDAPLQTAPSPEPQPETTPDAPPLTDVVDQNVGLDAVDAPINADAATTTTATNEPPIDPPTDIIPTHNRLDPAIVASLEAAVAEERDRTAALEAALEDARRDAELTNKALQEARAQANAARAAISGLRAENDALKSAPRQSPVAAGAIALNAIVEAAETGAPYARELATLKQAAPDAAATGVLAQYADTGAPALSDIRERFETAARAGLANANRENANGLVERYGARIAGLFNIRPATPQPGAAPGAIISRAEHAVDQGDLLLAVSELEALPTSAQNAMGEWMTLARQRAEFDAALRSLNADLAERATRGAL